MKKIFLFLALVCQFLFGKADIIVLDPAGVEIFYMLNAEDRIAAIASLQSNEIYPYDKTQNLPTVGTYSKPSLEKIIALNPKLVILSYHSTNLKEDLQRVNIESFFLKADTLEEILSNIKKIAQVTGKEKEADAIIATFNESMQKFKNHPIGKKGVFFYTSAPLMAFGKNTLPGDILSVLGVENIAHESVGDKPILNQEYILQSDPDFILYGLTLKRAEELYKTNPLLKSTKAFKQGNILPVNASLLLRGSPRIISEIESLYQELLSLK